MSPPITWTLEPSVLVFILAASVLYAWAWRRARGPGEPHPPGWGRLALFAGAMLCVLAALISPIDALATDLLLVHMVQHLLLLDLMPILLILSLTKGILRPVTRRMTAVERRAGVLGHPAFAVFLYVFVMYLWHIPALYDFALAHGDVHILEHICFSVAGTLYWWHLLSPIRGRMRLGGMGPVVYMVTTKFFVGVLGIVLAFSTTALYPWYEHHPHYWGLRPRVDQNLAGLLMALEQSIVMGIALVYLFVRMLTRASARRSGPSATRRSERRSVSASGGPTGGESRRRGPQATTPEAHVSCRSALARGRGAARQRLALGVGRRKGDRDVLGAAGAADGLDQRLGLALDLGRDLEPLQHLVGERAIGAREVAGARRDVGGQRRVLDERAAVLADGARPWSGRARLEPAALVRAGDHEEEVQLPVTGVPDVEHRLAGASTGRPRACCQPSSAVTAPCATSAPFGQPVSLLAAMIFAATAGRNRQADVELRVRQRDLDVGQRRRAQRRSSHLPRSASP